MNRDFRLEGLRLGAGPTLRAGAGPEERLGALEELVLPTPGMQVRKSAGAKFVLLLDAHLAVRRAGAAGPVFEPLAAEVRDPARTGRLTGILRDHDTNVRVAGAVVTAQVPAGGHGRHRIVRSAVTGPDGAFTLDLLPPGADYRVVALPGGRHDLACSDALQVRPEGVPPVALLAHALAERPGSLAVQAVPQSLGAPAATLALVLREVESRDGRGPLHLVAAYDRLPFGGRTFGPLAPGPYRVAFHAFGAGAGLQADVVSAPVQVLAAHTTPIPSQ